MSEPKVVLPIGSTFAGDFVVEGSIGEGGMGAVHRVRQISTDKARALKVMKPELVADVVLRRRFVQEARVGARIQSDHVVEVQAAGIDEATHLPYLVMELLDGEDLEAHLAPRGALTAAQMTEILDQVFHAMGAAHAVGVVHRDIKPENIFLGQSRRSGTRLDVKLLDFGIAKVTAEAQNTLSTAALGSPLWMAPEQTGRGAITPGADVFSLGLLTFQMLTGAHFWRVASRPQMSFGLLARELLIDPIPAASTRADELGRADMIPPGFDEWLARSLVRDVTSRFAEGAAQWAALRPILAAAPVSHPASSVSRFASTVSAMPNRNVASTASVAALASRLSGPLGSLAIKLRSTNADFAQRCALVEIAGAAVRYAAALALARLANEKDWQPSATLAAKMAGAARWSEGTWCSFASALHDEIATRDPAFAARLSFLTGDRPNAIAAIEDRLMTDTGTIADIGNQVNTMLEAAAPLFELPLRTMRAVGAAADHLVLVDGDRLLNVEPWLSRVDARICLPDAPHAAGESWRTYDIERGEHRHAPSLDAALRALVGSETKAPPAMNHAPPLLGREAALETVRRAAREAAAGAVRVVVISGPLGIGRTRLLRAVSGETKGFADVLEASCSRDRRSPLRPLASLFGNRASLARVDEAVTRGIRSLRAESPENVESTVETVEEELLDVSLMLVIDELQWADEATLLLLSLLTERASMQSRGKLLVVASVRAEPNPSARLSALLGQIGQEAGPGASRVELLPLDREDSRRLVRSVAPVDDAIVDHLVANAGGVPTFLVQPLLTWNENGSLQWRDGAFHATSTRLWSQAPPGMPDLVRARLASYFGARTPLLHAAESILAIVAVAGRTSAERIGVVVGALDIEVPLVESALESLVEAALLGRSETGIGFRQPLLQRAALELLEGRPWFGRTYRAYLDVLAKETDGGADAAILAMGYETLGRYDEARVWLERAARHALDGGLVEIAVTFAERFATLAATPRDRAAAGLLAAASLLRAGRASDASRRLVEVDWLGVEDPELVVRGRILGVSICGATGEPLEGNPERVLAAADALADPRLAIEARVALAAVHRGRAGLGMLVSAEQRLAARPGTDALTRYRMRSLRLELLYEVKATPDEWRAVAALARTAARESGSLWAELDVEADLAVLEAEAGRPNVAVEILGHVVERASAARLATVARNAMNNIAACQRLAGNQREAADAARVAERAARDGGSWRHLAAALSTKAAALADLGASKDALAALDESIDLQRRIGGARIATALFRRAEVHRTLGDLPRARADIREVLERSEQAGLRADTARAQVWLALEDARAGLPGAAATLSGLVARTSGLLRESAEGRALLEGVRNANTHSP